MNSYYQTNIEQQKQQEKHINDIFGQLIKDSKIEPEGITSSRHAIKRNFQHISSSQKKIEQQQAQDNSLEQLTKLIQKISFNNIPSIIKQFRDISSPNLYSHFNSGQKILNMGFQTQIFNKQPKTQNKLWSGNVLWDKFSQSTKYKILSYLDFKQALDITSVTDPQRNLQQGNMIIWQYHGGPNQHFYIRFIANKCRIVAASTGFCLVVPNASIDNGSQLYVNPIRNVQNQQFELIPLNSFGETSLYQISTFCGKLVDVANHKTNNGNNVIQWQNTKGGKNQIWKIVPV